jgi:hypothetical protein
LPSTENEGFERICTLPPLVACRVLRQNLTIQRQEMEAATLMLQWTIASTRKLPIGHICSRKNEQNSATI